MSKTPTGFKRPANVIRNAADVMRKRGQTEEGKAPKPKRKLRHFSGWRCARDGGCISDRL